MKCKIRWCIEKSTVKEMCTPHYQQAYEGRDNQRILTRIETPEQYFQRIKILIDPPEGNHYKDLSQCWIWPRKLAHRYPDFQYKGKRQHIHKWSYELFIGPIGDKYVLHKCDRTNCYNPDHLYLGTQQQNMTDRFNRTGYRTI